MDTQKLSLAALAVFLVTQFNLTPCLAAGQAGGGVAGHELGGQQGGSYQRTMPAAGSNGSNQIQSGGPAGAFSLGEKRAVKAAFNDALNGGSPLSRSISETDEVGPETEDTDSETGLEAGEDSKSEAGFRSVNKKDKDHKTKRKAKRTEKKQSREKKQRERKTKNEGKRVQRQG